MITNHQNKISKMWAWLRHILVHLHFEESKENYIDKSQMRYPILIHLDNTLFIIFFVESRINSDIGVPHLLDHRHTRHLDKRPQVAGVVLAAPDLTPTEPMTNVSGVRRWPLGFNAFYGKWPKFEVAGYAEKNEGDHACSVALPS